MPIVEPSVDTALIKVDHLPLEQVRTLDDSALTRVLRRVLEDPEFQSQDPVAAFSNRV